MPPKETRLLLDLKRLCQHYQINELFINQNDDNELVCIPPKRDVYIPLKCYVAYDPEHKQVYFSQRLINFKNHWLRTLKDDLLTGRIDYHDYC